MHFAATPTPVFAMIRLLDRAGPIHCFTAYIAPAYLPHRREGLRSRNRARMDSDYEVL